MAVTRLTPGVDVRIIRASTGLVPLGALLVALAAGSAADAAHARAQDNPPPEIYVMNADGSAQRRLTRNPASDGAPVWSPDGRKIAFVNGGDPPLGNSEVFVMNADGSGQRRLTHFGRQALWSPDGRMIAFRSFGAGNVEIYVMNVDGTGLRNLTRTPKADEIRFAWESGQTR